MASAACSFLGRIPYREALALQAEVAADVACGARADTLLLLEHPPTITLGRRSSADDLLAEPAALERAGFEIHRIGRGGGATVHAPGQLVGYPIVRLAGGGRRVRHFVESLETMLARVLAGFGLEAELRPGSPGIWARGAKLAAIGIEVKRGVTRHGFALNVDMDLSAYAAIVPCRTPGLAVGDLRRASGRAVTLEAAVSAVAGAWQDGFGTPSPTKGREWTSNRSSPVLSAATASRSPS
ncbi:MAG: lipoyl(octanoyl) transferase LipB [Candidatus Binatia bacterium]